MNTIPEVYNRESMIPLIKTPGNNVSNVALTFFDERQMNLEAQMETYIAESIFDFWGNERDEDETTSLNEK